MLYNLRGNRNPTSHVSKEARAMMANILRPEFVAIAL